MEIVIKGCIRAINASNWLRIAVNVQKWLKVYRKLTKIDKKLLEMAWPENVEYQCHVQKYVAAALA